MKKVTRRRILSSAGLVAGAGLLAAGHDQLFRSESHAQPEPSDWKYVRLDRALVAEKAYEMFPEGGCMYGLVGSIVTTLGDMVGEPYRSFPFAMMRYGFGGTGAWGTLCGALNGAAAIIGLLHQEEFVPWIKDGQESKGARLIGRLFSWYETAELPKYRPTGASDIEEMPSSVAESVLCHVSLSKWSQASTHDVYSAQKVERCRRLTADVTIRTVELLNRELVEVSGRTSAQPPASAGLTPEVESCVSCHGKRELRDAFGKMSCNSCHALSKEHPE